MIKRETLKRFQPEGFFHVYPFQWFESKTMIEARRNLEKVTFRGIPPEADKSLNSIFSMVGYDKKRNLEKIQQEEKPYKPFQG